ncbi:hypothetical protein JB92DRAFT_2866350, partial [Gautieria morchelliformis]
SDHLNKSPIETYADGSRRKLYRSRGPVESNYVNITMTRQERATRLRPMS